MSHEVRKYLKVWMLGMSVSDTDLMILYITDQSVNR